MLHYIHKQHRHRRSQKFFHWSAKSTFCLTISGCWRYNANGCSHNALPFLHHKENDPCYGNSPKNALRWQQRFFSHRIKGRDLVSYCNQQSLSRCIACHRCLQQSHAAKRLLPQLKANLCCHVTVTQWRSILEISAPKFRNLPLQAM